MTASSGESAVVDQGCGDGSECEEVFCLALVASVQAAASGEPGHGSLDNPAMSAQPFRGLDALTSDAMPDAALAQPSAQVVVVVAFVAVQLGQAPAPWAAPRADGRDTLHERLQAEAVVHVGCGDAE